MEFRIVGPGDEAVLAALFADIDETFFRPHPFTPEEAHRIANLGGHDVYGLLMDGERPVAYGMLRGWDEGYETPSLGIAVRTGEQGRGLGRLMMAHLHHEVRARGCALVRLRVHADNIRARLLYESLGYGYRGEERGELLMILDVGGRRATDARTPVDRETLTPAAWSSSATTIEVAAASESPDAEEPIPDFAPRVAVGHGAAPGIRLLRPEDAGWDGALEGVRRDVYHLSGYHSYARSSGEGEPHLALVGNRRRGLAWPYLLRRLADIPGLAGTEATDVTSVYGYPGPIAWGCQPGDPFLEQAWSAVRAAWHEQGVVAAFTRFHPLLDNAALAAGFTAPAEPGLGSVGVVSSGPTVAVDLSVEQDAVRAAYGRDLRREIAASRRAGLVTTHDEDWAHLPTFTRLYHETMVRSGATDYYFFSEDQFRRLRDSLDGHLHLLVTSIDGTVAAAGLFSEFEGLAEWYLVGSNDAFRMLSPSKVLVDDAIEWARGRGNTVLHMGGGRGGREDSLLWFKGRFSPLRHRFHTGRWVLEPDRYRDFVEAARTAAAGQGVPDPGFFPAYRAPMVELNATTAMSHLPGGANAEPAR